MGLSSKTVTIASAMAGLAVFSQAPEFAQQYRQRIGGAVDELKTVVMDFDKDASNSQLSREQALDQMTKSGERLTHDRGQSMTRTVGRFERLHEQQKWLENSHPLTRPLLVLKNLDRPLLENAWGAYEPAVPLTSSGAMYGALGAFIALIMARLGIGSTRRLRQRRSDKHLEQAIEPSNSSDYSQNEGAQSAIGEGQKNENEEHRDNSDPQYDNTLLARRMEQTLSRSSGVPESMKVAPVPRENVPYLKIDPDK